MKSVILMYRLLGQINKKRPWKAPGRLLRTYAIRLTRHDLQREEISAPSDIHFFEVIRKSAELVPPSGTSMVNFVVFGSLNSGGIKLNFFAFPSLVFD